MWYTVCPTVDVLIYGCAGLLSKQWIKICFTEKKSGHHKNLCPTWGGQCLCKIVLQIVWSECDYVCMQKVSANILCYMMSSQQSLRPCCSFFLKCLCPKGLSCRTTLQILSAVKPPKKLIWNNLYDPFLGWTDSSFLESFFCIMM